MHIQHRDTELSFVILTRVELKIEFNFGKTRLAADQIKISSGVASVCSQLIYRAK